MNTATTTTNATITLNESFAARRNAFDWIFAALVLLGGLFALQRYANYMDGYEKAILLGTIPAVIWLGWFWRPLRALMLGAGAGALLAISLYQQGDAGSLARADTVFLAQILFIQPICHSVDEHVVLHEHHFLLAEHVRQRRRQHHVFAGFALGLDGGVHGLGGYAGALVRELLAGARY